MTPAVLTLAIAVALLAVAFLAGAAPDPEPVGPSTRSLALG